MNTSDHVEQEVLASMVISLMFHVTDVCIFVDKVVGNQLRQQWFAYVQNALIDKENTN